MTTIRELRASLADKAARGVKQVRVSTMLESLPETVEEAFPDATDDRVRTQNRTLRERVATLEQERKDARRRVARSETAMREAHAAELAGVRAGTNGKPPAIGLDALAEQSQDDPQRYGDVDVKGVLVGTAEAAAMLGVERPRIGRWLAMGKLPPPVAELRAGPVWLREDIESKREDVESRRKPRSRVVNTPSR